MSKTATEPSAFEKLAGKTINHLRVSGELTGRYQEKLAEHEKEAEAVRELLPGLQEKLAELQYEEKQQSAIMEKAATHAGCIELVNAAIVKIAESAAASAVASQPARQLGAPASDEPLNNSTTKQVKSAADEDWEHRLLGTD